jgi:hypothetical protein
MVELDVARTVPVYAFCKAIIILVIPEAVSLVGIVAPENITLLGL